jgi:hypothetical protein
MANSPADRNLLFGNLAVQMDFILKKRNFKTCASG